MAKLTANGVTIEGTVVELALIMAQFSTKDDEVESVDVDVDPFEVGDYAKVVVQDTTFNGVYKVGDIVKITKIDDSSVPYRAGDNGNNERWFSLEHLSEVSVEEVAKAKAQAEVNAVFTDAGRKPNEYRTGDIVRVLDTLCTFYLHVGQITEVAEDSEGNSARVRSYNGEARNAVIEIVTFVENRLDRN